MLRSTLVELAKGKEDLQVTAVSEPALRGLRALFSVEEAEKLGIELLPLGNLVSRACRLAHLQTRHIAQTGQVEAAIAEACKRLPGDSPLASGALMPGIHRALAETLRALRAHGLDSTRLDLAADEVGEHLAAKLRSLGFVLRESEESLRLLGREHLTSWLQRSVESDPKECENPGRVVIVIGGELDPALAAWIDWLAQTPGKLTLIGETHPKLPSMFAQDSEFFPGTKPEFRVEESAVSGLLFAPDVNPTSAISLEVVASSDLLAECEWALRGCERALVEGVAATQVAVVARELGSYAPAIQASARRLGVPISLPWRASLLSNRLVAFFLELLEALGSSDVRSLIKPLKSVYSGLDSETQAVVEDVLRELRRSGPEAWGVLESVAGALTDRVAWLEPVLEWRAEAMKQPTELWEWFRKIMELAELIPWQDAAMAFPEFIERDSRAQTAMHRALTEKASLAKVHRLPPLDYSHALQWMRAAWDDADYSVPSQPGGVRVVSNGSELGECRVVFVLGMLEGVLPRRPREDPILGDLERDALSAAARLTVPLPTSKQEAAREREEFVRICSAAGERLVLSYRTATGERNNIPTAYIKDAERVIANPIIITHSRTQLVPEEPKIASDMALANAFDGPRQRLARSDFDNPVIRRRFAWSTDRSFRPHQLKRAATCPFRFFARDVLELKPTRRLQVWNGLLELPETAKLASQPDRESAQTALTTVLEEFIDVRVGRLANWELALIKSGGRRMVADWVEREFSARELWPRHDVQLDVPIGSPGILPKAGPDVTLEGTVPATGRMGPYSYIRLYELSAPDKLGRDSADADFLYYALWAIIAKGDAEGTAIEIETLGHTRRLFVLPRLGGALRSDKEIGLFAAPVTVAEEDVIKSAKARARGLIQVAVQRARGAEVTPTPGQHCTGCAYGELCRRSNEYGESDDPFEVDLG